MTTNFILAPGEVFINCPYNPSHLITNARLITHLTKCREAFLKPLSNPEKSKVMRICRHNALHHVPYQEIKLHEESCKDANSIVSFMSYHNSEEGRKQYEERKRLEEGSRQPHSSQRVGDQRDNVQEVNQNSAWGQSQASRAVTNAAPTVTNSNDNQWGIEEDDWEAEASGYTAGYDPQQKLKNEVIILNPSGMTKSERKKYREGQRQRSLGIQIVDDDESQSNTYSSTEDWDMKLNTTDLQRLNIRSESGDIDEGDEGEGEVGADRLSSSSSGSPIPSTSKNLGASWYGSEVPDEEADSDDFEGMDPYDCQWVLARN